MYKDFSFMSFSHKRIDFCFLKIKFKFKNIYIVMICLTNSLFTLSIFLNNKVFARVITGKYALPQRDAVVCPNISRHSYQPCCKASSMSGHFAGPLSLVETNNVRVRLVTFSIRDAKCATRVSISLKYSLLWLVPDTAKS